MTQIRFCLIAALVLFLISLAASRVAVSFGASHINRGPGYPGDNDVASDLFRFDSTYFYSIATVGYEYNGQPDSTPNIVFAPGFPLLVRAVTILGVDPVEAGFLINKILLFFALFFLVSALAEFYNLKKAFVILLALVTCAGSYSLHAYYSECTMLFFLSLILYGHVFKKDWVIALGGFGIGLSRIAAAPISLVLALWFLFYRERSLRNLIFAAFSVMGFLSYLLFIWIQFGNPFEILPEVQRGSWTIFHPQTDWVQLLTGRYIFQYWSEALDRGVATVLSIRTVNLVWTSLAGFSAVYMLWVYRRHLWTYLFGAYFLLLYVTNSGTSFLISANRFFLLMIPIFIMFANFHSWLSRRASRALAIAVSSLLLVINLAYGLYLTAYFNQGIFYYF